MRVALVRGVNLNRYEMQCYEPLADQYDITAIGARRGDFATDDIRLPIRRLRAFDDIVPIPAVVRNQARLLLRRYGLEHRLVGLEKVLRDFDLAHTSEVCTGFTHQAIAAKRRDPRLKVAVTIWENIPLARMTKGSFRLDHLGLRARALREADVFLAHSERSRQALLLEGVEDARIEVIMAGFDLSRFQPQPRDEALAARVGIAPGDRVVLFVGRLEWHKGIEPFVDAAAILKRRGAARGLKFVMVGRGPEEARLRARIRELGLEGQAIVAGFFRYDDMPRVHNLADVFVLPSVPLRWWQEQYGYVLGEAMACGKPVVSTFTGSIPEVVGDAGVLVQPGDALALADGLEALLADPKRMRALGEAGRARVHARFDAKVVAKQTGAVYARLAEGR